MIFRTAGGEPLRGWLHDVGRGGCFITTQSRLPVGETLELEMRLPGIVAPLAGKARVVWLREKGSGDLPAGMGVALVDLPAETVAAIEKVLGATRALQRPKTIIGIAPPPKASSPSFSPETPIEVPPPEPAAEAPAETEHPTTETLEDGIAAIHDVSQVTAPPEEKPEAAPAAPPPPPVPPAFAPPPMPLALSPMRSNRARILAIAGAAVALLGGVTCIAFAVRGCGADKDAGLALDAPAENAAESETPEAEAEEPDVTAAPTATATAEPIVDAGKDAHDAGRDAAHDGGKKDGGKDAGKKDAGKKKRRRRH